VTSFNFVYIYGLIDSTGAIRYVGKTNNLQRRLQEHKRIRPWVVGYKVLHRVIGEWSLIEKFCILHFGQYFRLENKGYQANTGLSAKRTGLALENIKRANRNPIKRKKISDFQTGRARTPAQLQVLTGLKSDSHKKAISVAKKGVPGPKHSQETKDKISAALKGKSKRSIHR